MALLTARGVFVRLFLRSLKDCSRLWYAWAPLLLVGILTPVLGMLLPLLEKRLIDEVLIARRAELLPAVIALYGAVWIGSSATHFAGAALRSLLSERVTLNFRQRVFEHCEKLSFAFSRQDHSAQTVSLISNDVPCVAALPAGIVPGLISCVSSLVVGLTLMFHLNWQLALAAGVLPPMVGGAAMLLTRPLRPLARQVQEIAAALTQRVQENLAGLREVAAFGQGTAQSVRFGAVLQELLRARMRLALIDGGIQTGQSALSLSITLVILGYGGYLLLNDRATLGTLVAMRSLFDLVFMPAGQVFGIFANGQKALASVERVYEFLDQEPKVAELPTAHSPGRARGEVTFDRVSFGYGAEHVVLQDITFTAAAGEVIALVGPSGAGKSSLASLILRFYDPGGGRVLLDGVNLRDLTLAGLRRQIGVVFQDTFLFSGSIRENLAFAREGATEQEITAAAQAANAWEFIERLPDGLDTQVGERGTKLSEGQKQRLAVARVFLRDPRILILDEPTSALDARSEFLLQEALEKLMRGRTTFVIAHRLSTVRSVDRILVISGGRIVEQGSHLHLLELGGLYAELFDLQFRGSEAPSNSYAPHDRNTPTLKAAMAGGATVLAIEAS
ncbi:MAG: ABC transporter ATP-binding protein [Actinomycetota bacterium]